MALSVHIRKKLKDFYLDVHFESESGCLGLLGSSGCGKSMTLKCIAGIETPDEGTIILNDRVLFDSAQKINLPPQKRKVGYLFQNYALFPNMTVRENVEEGLSGSGETFASKKEKDEFIQKLLDQFHVGELADSYPTKMSGGQQQRTALARIVASSPDILLLDEPFSALDSYLREQLLQEMKGFLQSYQKDVVMVSHNRDEVYQMCEQMAVMGEGTIEISGETRALFANPVTAGAARLTGCKNISEIEILDSHTFYASDWNMKFHLPEAIPTGVTHVGIRAHDLREAVDGDENVMECELDHISEAPFEMYLILKNKDTEDFVDKGNKPAPVWWKISKKEWQEAQKNVPEKICFPPEHLLLLK
ncbi:MAG: ATP-binding cassette domain-containing protein [Anaerobutyricum sp.]|nr:ATP-binding cassette domain-containing protein [Eubacterium sp.]MDY6046566.1 ATP-binding cassette domain-containing protein [Anaerobutyricum sp.]